MNRQKIKWRRAQSAIQQFLGPSKSTDLMKSSCKQSANHSLAAEKSQGENVLRDVQLCSQIEANFSLMVLKKLREEYSLSNGNF